MKTKLDFVTNSSSTNFCVYGIEVKFSNFLLMNNIHILVYVYYLCSPYREVGKFPQTDGSWKGSDFVSMNDLLDNTKGHNSVLINSTESMIRAIFGMESIVNTYGEIFIGMNPFKIGNDETGVEFRDKVQKKLKSLLGITVKPYAIDERVEY